MLLVLVLLVLLLLLLTILSLPGLPFSRAWWHPMLSLPKVKQGNVILCSMRLSGTPTHRGLRLQDFPVPLCRWLQQCRHLQHHQRQQQQQQQQEEVEEGNGSPSRLEMLAFAAAAAAATAAAAKQAARKESLRTAGT